MKNFKLTAFLAVFLLSAFVSSAWATDATVTYDIGYTGGTFDRTGFITRADNSSLTFTWDRGAGVVWRADYAYGVDDEYDITFTPNKELDSHDKIFTTEHNTTFTVTTAAENNYRIKSVVFMDANNVTTGSSTGYNKKTVTVTVPSSKDIVHVTVTLIPLSGSCGDNATWTMTDEDGNDTYETLTITGTGAITSSPWATDFAATISRVNIGNAELSISGNPFSTLGSEVAIVVPTPAYAVTYSNAAYAAKLRVALGSYLFKATGTADDAAYEIATETDLRNLSAAIDATENISSGKKFRQTTDIAMTGGNFTPIGNVNEFQGTYDGQGYTISGLSISGDYGNIGFFGIIYGASVRNVVLVNPTVRGNNINGGSSELGSLIGLIVGPNPNTIENCYVINPMLSIDNSNEADYLGAFIGKIFSDYTTVSNCYYYDNAHNYASIGTNDGGTLTNVGRARKVTFGEGVSIAAPTATEGFSYDIDGDDKVDYFYREGINVPVSVADANGIIDEISGVKASDVTLAEDKRSATFTMPGENVDISATTSEVHTVSVPEGLAISDDAYVTIGDVNYYKTGESYTLTTTKANYVIDGITGVTATVLKDKRSATFTMPSENVEISATISKIWGDGDGTEEHPYTIASTLELDLLASAVNSGNSFANTYFEVIENIYYRYLRADGKENNYTAIGSEDCRFKGKFNGNGKTIKGIRIYEPRGKEYQGLFGYLGNGAEVKNVKLTDVIIRVTHYAGGIAGFNWGTVSDCVVERTQIMGELENSQYYGGIVGYNNGKVSNNLAKGVYVFAGLHYGAVAGASKYKNPSLSYNFYTACSVGKESNATGIGVGGMSSSTQRDVPNGAVAVSVTAPAAVENLVYNESSQELVTAGATNYGALHYSLDGTTYSEDIPSATNAGSYTVYYRVVSDKGIVVDAQKVKVSIAPISVLASGAVKVFEDQNGKYAEIDGNFGGSVDAPNTDAVNITERISVDNISFNRTFLANDGLSTVVFPFEVNTSQLSGVDSVFYFAQMTYDKNGDRAVGIRKAWGKTCAHIDLKPNTPYMVQMEMDQSNIGISGPVTLVPTTEAVKQSEKNDGWEFRGTYVFKQWLEDDGDVCRVYGYAATYTEDVSAGEFVKFTAGARLRPLRAYLINTNKTCPTAQPAAQNAPQLARANGDNVVRASMKYAGEELPEYMNVVILGDNEEHTTIIGRINTRTGEFTSVDSNRKFDIKGRSVRGKPSAHGAYYKKNLKK